MWWWCYLALRALQLIFGVAILAVSATIQDQLARAGRLPAQYNRYDPEMPRVVEYILSNPTQICLGVSIAVWSVVVGLYLTIAPPWRKARLAQFRHMVVLEFLTVVLWSCALGAFANFAVQVASACPSVDDAPLARKMVEICLLARAVTPLAAVSWFLWLVTCIAQLAQARGNKAPIATRGQTADPPSYWASTGQSVSKGEQAAAVATLEMQFRGV